MIKIDFTTKPKEIEHKYVVDQYGNKCLYNENKLYHSYDDLPSVIWPDATKFWHKHGQRHRENGLPAIVNPNGSEQYWENGKRIK